MSKALDAATDFSFAGLTPDLIANALASVGVDPASGLLALNSYENRVYQFVADDRCRYVAKFYRPARWSDAQILEEHAFTAELLAEDVPAVAPLVLDGQTLHTFQGYRFSVFPSVGGRAVEPGDLDHLERIGRQIGRLHAVAQQGQFTYRKQLNAQDFVADSLDTLRATPLIPDNLQQAFWAILEPLAEQLYSVDLSKFAQQRLHGDCHLGNMLLRDDLLTFVDFDDAMTGPAIQDLWMMLAGDDRQQRWQQLDALVSGYEEFCEFDERETVLIEPLRGFRIIHYMAWLARRWQDAAFQRAFPWFAEQRYWEQQVLVLKEQFAALQEAPLELRPNFNC
ncbi:serine/threonine protein kinase [Pseudidiomarina sediminum]|uniref:serine/threonine protein kinase n=1 Tax=Pseudidiomarina sediminum TaxID=431675 RepID=UPI001C978574|nr:serine/threonine protein kinase [Pseudidiomarina sediminum]MBY6064294.1 serine/threonine protein kinase [Pseudidiomarina sediminum]